MYENLKASDTPNQTLKNKHRQTPSDYMFTSSHIASCCFMLLMNTLQKLKTTRHADFHVSSAPVCDPKTQHRETACVFMPMQKVIKESYFILKTAIAYISGKKLHLSQLNFSFPYCCQSVVVPKLFPKLLFKVWFGMSEV